MQLIRAAGAPRTEENRSLHSGGLSRVGRSTSFKGSGAHPVEGSQLTTEECCGIVNLPSYSLLNHHSFGCSTSIPLRCDSVCKL